ncbi:hypothetical protein [Azospirillum thermophilum]|nr:hypothetical protein [Azospirillum thermophilum]
MTTTGVIREMAGARVGRKNRIARAGLMLGMLLLAGCPSTTVTPVEGLPTTAAPSPAKVAKAVRPKPKVKPIPPPASDQAQMATVPEGTGTGTTSYDGTAVAAATTAQPVAGAIPPDVVPASPPPKLDPNTLVGLDQSQTRRLLGIPASTEEAPPAKVWRYTKGDCTLKVFFFMDMTSTQDFRALSYDMKSSQNVPDHDNRCFAQLVAQAGNVRND